MKKILLLFFLVFIFCSSEEDSQNNLEITTTNKSSEVSDLDTETVENLETTEKLTTKECSFSNDLKNLPVGINQFTLEQRVLGVQTTRDYIIHTTEDIDLKKCYPVLFYLHGYGVQVDENYARYGMMYEYIEAGNFIGIYPQGYMEMWNVGRYPSPADDVQFIELIIESLETYKGLKLEETYVVGMSNGGGLAHELGVETNNFKKIVPIVYNLRQETEGKTFIGSPKVLQILGEEDETVPYAGGSGQPLGEKYISGDRSAQIWSEQNKCSEIPKIETYFDETTKTLYEGCDNNSSVVNYKVSKAGHAFSVVAGVELRELIFLFLTDNLHKAVHSKDSLKSLEEPSNSEQMPPEEEEFINVKIPNEAPEVLQVIESKLNDIVFLMFESSEPLEVHIHGIDLYLEINGITGISFNASVEGELEIEVHDSGGNYQFARLIISP